MHEYADRYCQKFAEDSDIRISGVFYRFGGILQVLRLILHGGLGTILIHPNDSSFLLKVT